MLPKTYYWTSHLPEMELLFWYDYHFRNQIGLGNNSFNKKWSILKTEIFCSESHLKTKKHYRKNKRKLFYLFLTKMNTVVLFNWPEMFSGTAQHPQELALVFNYLLPWYWELTSTRIQYRWRDQAARCINQTHGREYILRDKAQPTMLNCQWCFIYSPSVHMGLLNL